MFTMDDLFDIAINMEKNGDPAAKKGLDMIVKEEKKHVDNLCEMISKL